MVESFLGAPLVIDAVGLGFETYSVSLYWTNWCGPEILRMSIPTYILPNPPFEKI